MTEATATGGYDAAGSASKTVERIAFDRLTAEDFYRSYRAPSRPVIITGALPDGTDWTLDYLRAQFGDARFPARHYGRDQFKRPIFEWSRYSEMIDLAFVDYADMLTDRRAHRDNIYMAQVNVGLTPSGAALRTAVDALAARTGMAPLLDSDLNLWLGPSGHTEPLHFDPGDGTLMQVHGAKQVVLFPPRSTAGLYPFPVAKGPIPPWVSQVSVRAPDFGRFPRLQRALAERYEVTLRHGEILFIPAFWWHEVTALGSDYVCSVNRFWHVEPVRRNFVTARSAMMFLMNQVPFETVVAADRAIRRVREGRPAHAS